MFSSRRFTAPSLLAIAFFLLAAPRLSAQFEQDRSKHEERRVLEESKLLETEAGLDTLSKEIEHDLDLDYGGMARAAYYHYRDNIRMHTLRYYDLRLWSNLVYKDSQQIYVRVMGNISDYSSNDEYSYMEENDLNVPRLDVGYYYGDVGRYLGVAMIDRLRLKVGRQYVRIGEGLVLDTRGDGALVEQKGDTFAFTGFILRSIYSEEGYDRSYPDYGHNKNLHSGFEVGAKISDEVELFGYTTFLNDKRRDSRFTLAPLPNYDYQKFKYNSRYHGIGLRGTLGTSLSWYGEYAVQKGKRYSDYQHTILTWGWSRDDIDAFGFQAGADYTFLDTPLTPTLSVQHVFGSGDHDMGVGSGMDTWGNTTNPFDPQYGGNKGGTTDNTFFSYGYINTGYAFFPLVSNVEVWRTGIDLTPFKNHEIFGSLEGGFNYFRYRKHSSRGGMSDRGLDLAGEGSALGYELDFYVAWRPYSDLSLIFLYGHFKPDHDSFTDTSRRSYTSLGMIVYF